MSRKSSDALRIVLRVLMVAAVVVLCAYGLQRFNWKQVGHALAGTRIELILVASFMSFVVLFCKASRWDVMLPKGHGISRLRLMWYLIVSYAASIILPARAGEAVRVVVLQQRHAVPAGASVGLVVAEKLFEVLAFVFVLAPLPLLIPLPRGVGMTLAGLAIAAVVALLLSIPLARRLRRDEAPSLFRRFAGGAAALMSLRPFLWTVLWSVLAYLADLLSIVLALAAVGIDATPAMPLCVLLGVNLAIAIPSTPAGVGAFEAGAIAGLSLTGVPAERGVVLAVAYHAMQVLPTLLIGLTGIKLIDTRSRASSPAPAPEVEDQDKKREPGSGPR